MNKTYRQGQILRLIRSKKVYTQEALAGELGTLNIQTTQVTLSRDIRELGLVKTPDGYREVAGAAPGPDVDSVIAEFLLEARVAQNLLVLKTPPGYANSLASALDHSDWKEIVGTIAGDDTILVVAPDNSTAKKLREKLLAFLTT